MRNFVEKIVVVILVFVLSFQISSSNILQVNASEETELLILTDNNRKYLGHDTMNTEELISDLSKILNYEYVLLNYSNIVNYFDFDIIEQIVENGTKIILDVQDLDKAQEYVNQFIDENIKLYIKGCEFKGLCIYNKNGILSVSVIANAVFNSEMEVEESVFNMENSNTISNNNIEFLSTYAPSALDELYEMQKEEIVEQTIDTSVVRVQMPPSNFDREFNDVCTCSKADGTLLGYLFITQYVYDICTYVNEDGNINKIFDVVSSFRVAPTDSYNVHSFTARMSCNQENQECIDETNLLSDGTVAVSLGGGISGIGDKITGDISGSTEYSTSTSGLTISNKFPSLKERDWHVETNVSMNGNARRITPGIRVKNIDCDYLSGVGSYFEYVCFYGVLPWSSNGEILFAGGQW